MEPDRVFIPIAEHLQLWPPAHVFFSTQGEERHRGYTTFSTVKSAAEASTKRKHEKQRRNHSTKRAIDGIKSLRMLKDRLCLEVKESQNINCV